MNLHGGRASSIMDDTSGLVSEKERPKPPHSYIALIATAILESHEKRLTLAEINDYLVKHYSFFRGSYQGWKNSVRHNLSFNSCFVKILRDPTRPWGKDNYWTISSLRDYLMDDGTFRRRRRRTSKKTIKSAKSRAEQKPEVKHANEVTPRIPQENSNTANTSKFTSSFSIENLLADSKTKALRTEKPKQQQREITAPSGKSVTSTSSMESPISNSSFLIRNLVPTSISVTPPRRQVFPSRAPCPPVSWCPDSRLPSATEHYKLCTESRQTPVEHVYKFCPETLPIRVPVTEPFKFCPETRAPTTVEHYKLCPCTTSHFPEVLPRFTHFAW